MSQKFWFHICARQRDDMTTPMALNARDIVFDVARKASPGATIEGKKRFVERALDYPSGSWRVHAAWYLQAGSWSAQAMHDLQVRYAAWREAEARRAASVLETEKTLQMQRDLALLENERAKHVRALAAIEARLAVLSDPGVDGPH